MAVACVVNIIGDLILVAGFHLDAAGAAIATVAAQAVSVVLAIVLLKKKDLKFGIQKKDFRINGQCKRFLKVGLPLALQEFLTQMSFLALCAFVNKLGLEASSGYGVACKIVNFAMLVPSSLMQSMASFVSQNVGAGKPDRAKKSMFTGMGLGVIVGVVVFICVWCFGDVLTSVFTTDTAVIQKGTEYLRGFAPETIVTAVLFSMVGFFNGYEKNGMGDDTGTGPDLAGKTAACLCYEYTAACKPYKNRTGSAGCHLFWNRVECHFLFDFYEENGVGKKKKKELL